MTDKKNREIELLRVFATLLVVIGHSGFYTITTSISSMGCDWTEYIQDGSIVYKIIGLGTRIIYSCHMQLFIFMSGMVFQICLNGGKYRTASELLKNKFSRLIIPYFLVTVLYNIPVLWYADYFGGSICNAVLYVIGFGKNHLWYLEVLFFIFMLTYVCKYILTKYIKFQKRTTIGLMMIPAVFMYFLSEYAGIRIIEFAYIDRVTKYWIWFLVGMFFVEQEYNIKQFFNKNVILKISVVFAIWMISFLLVDNGMKFLAIEEQLFGIMFWYSISYQIVDKFPAFLNNRIIKSISKYSMDIYLYGVPINYVIMTLLINVNVIVYLNNATSLLLFLSRIFLQITVGIVLPQLLRMLKN